MTVGKLDLLAAHGPGAVHDEGDVHGLALVLGGRRRRLQRDEHEALAAMGGPDEGSIRAGPQAGHGVSWFVRVLARHGCSSPIELEDVRRASSIVVAGAMTARDALHLAVMQRRGIARIMTFDRAFDGILGIARLGGAG